MTCNRVAVYVNRFGQTYTAPVRAGVEVPTEVVRRDGQYELKCITTSEDVPINNNQLINQ